MEDLSERKIKLYLHIFFLFGALSNLKIFSERQNHGNTTYNKKDLKWSASHQHLAEVIMKTKQYIHIAAAALFISATQLSVFHAMSIRRRNLREYNKPWHKPLVLHSISHKMKICTQMNKTDTRQWFLVCLQHSFVLSGVYLIYLFLTWWGVFWKYGYLKKLFLQESKLETKWPSLF